MDYNSYGGGQSYNTYGAASDANNGGGFVGGEPASSQVQGRGRGRETIRPVTIAQIMSASQAHPDADFKIDGESIAHLTFVGQVRSVQPQVTNITYKVDDGTGMVEVKQWIESDAGNYNDNDDDDDDEYGNAAGGMDIDGGNVKQEGQDEANKAKAGRKRKEIKEDDYVRVWGKLKDFNGKRHIGSHIIRRISDYNEINYHLLEATSVHLFFSRGPPLQQQQQLKAGGAGLAQQQQQQQQQQQDYSTSGPSLPSSISPGGRKVYQCLREANNNEGLNVHVIASNAGMNVTDVYRGVDELVQEGVIFTTLDDETYAILDA